MAGVAEMLCDEDDKVLQLEQFDPFGFDKYYGRTETISSLPKLIKRALEIYHDYDKIVIHDFEEFKNLFPKNKVILFFHGTKLRNMPEEQREGLADFRCYVSTSDLLDYIHTATYLPVPVDLELFANDNGTEFEIEKKGSWLCINRTYQQEFIEPAIRARYPEIEYYERSAGNIIDYEDMPNFLDQYTDYVDWKFGYEKLEPKTTPVPSCTGLQALSVGCRVWDHNGMQLSRHLLVIHDRNRVREKFRNEN